MDNDSSSSGLEDASLSVSPVTRGGARGRDSPELPGAETLSPGRRRGAGPKAACAGVSTRAGTGRGLSGAALWAGALTLALTHRPLCSEAAAEESGLSCCARPEGPVTP